MCGRYANHVKQMGQWDTLLGQWPDDVEFGYNIAPSQRIPGFTAEGGLAMRWGMVPPWSKQPSSKYATFNARSETVADKPAFRHAWKASQTCLVPAIGYYEWKRDGGNGKQPYFIRPREDRPLVMAGLWETWRNQEEDIVLHSCTIITRPSSGELASLHHRMPLFVNLDQGEQWLNDGVTVFQSLLDDQDVSSMEYYAVDKAVNNTRNESEALIRPMENHSGAG